MKVKKLIELLKQANPEHSIILASDAEGNHFSELTEVELDCFCEIDFQEVYDKDFHTRDKDEYDEDEIENILLYDRAVVFWPA